MKMILCESDPLFYFLREPDALTPDEPIDVPDELASRWHALAEAWDAMQDELGKLARR
jgi:hypothetical protein